MYSIDNACRFLLYSISNMLFPLYFSVVRILYNALRRWVVMFSLFQKRKRVFAIILPPTSEIQDGASLDKYLSFRFTTFRFVRETNHFTNASISDVSILCLSIISGMQNLPLFILKAEIVPSSTQSCLQSTFSEHDYETAESDIWTQSSLYFHRKSFTVSKPLHKITILAK